MTDEQYRFYDKIVADLFEIMQGRATDKAIILSAINVKKPYHLAYLTIAKLVAKLTGRKIKTSNFRIYKWLHHKYFKGVGFAFISDVIMLDDLTDEILSKYDITIDDLNTIYEEYYA